MFGLCIPSKNTFNQYDEPVNTEVLELHVAPILPNFNLETRAPTKGNMETKSWTCTKEHWKDQTLESESSKFSDWCQC